MSMGEPFLYKAKHCMAAGNFINPHAQRERGKVIGCGVQIYVCGVQIYVCGRKKYLNRTLPIDSPFQAFAVGLLVEFIDYLYHCALQKRSPR